MSLQEGESSATGEEHLKKCEGKQVTDFNEMKYPFTF